ncbi:MAG TPA: alpha/beta hydrolase-fold protein [Bryobacteraceae bacterium]|nr:alpha/beta hydrolase-fold protein [Bryobacteraceae bacterium]
MSRALISVLLAASLAGLTGLAEAKKASKDSKPAARQELVAPPVAPPGAPAIPAHPSPYNFPGVQYPRIEADNRVTFHFNAPNAQKVQVSIVNVPFDMVKGADGVWTYTSAPQPPGYHNYWMIVDGGIVLDPGTQAFIGYGHMCNGFEVPEPGVDWYDIKDVAHGHVTAENYFAKSINAWRHIYVYTPPGYDASLKTRYPVFYLQHGGGEDERVWIEMGRTNVILDNLLAQGKVKPMIVVMETSATGAPDAAGGRPGIAGAPPAGGAGRGPGTARGAAAPGGAGQAPGGAPPVAGAPAGRGAGFPGIGGPGGGAYGQFMTTELIPWVDSHFRTVADKDHRAMAGLSMGGMQTASVTMANLDKFSYIGFFSGGAATGFGPGRGRGGAPGAPGAAPPAAPAQPAPPAPLDFKTIYNGQMAVPAEFNKKVKVLFMSCGSVENPDALKAHQQQLAAAGIANSYVYISPGTAHEWQTWRRSLYAFAPLLFR